MHWTVHLMFAVYLVSVTVVGGREETVLKWLELRAEMCSSVWMAADDFPMVAGGRSDFMNGFSGCQEKSGSQQHLVVIGQTCTCLPITNIGSSQSHSLLLLCAPLQRSISQLFMFLHCSICFCGWLCLYTFGRDGDTETWCQMSF